MFYKLMIINNCWKANAKWLSLFRTSAVIYGQRSFVSKQFTPHDGINKMVEQRHHRSLDLLHKSRKDRDEEYLRPKANNFNATDNRIKKLLHNSTSSSETLSIIQSHISSINHVSIFGKAIKQCIKQRSWDIVIQIMDLAVQSEIDLDLIQLQPTSVLISTLIKGCKRQRRYSLAETYWSWLQNAGISPEYLSQQNTGHFVYNEMMNVCSNSAQSERAVEIFTEFYTYFKHNVEDDPYLYFPIFNTYLTVYCREGDINGMNDALSLMKQHGYSLHDISITRNIMKCYHRARQHIRCWEIYHQYVSNGACASIDASMINMKNISLSFLIADDVDNKYTFEEKEKFYLEIVDGIYTKMKQIGETVTQHLAIPQLLAAIHLYRSVDAMKAIKVFEKMVADGLAGYKFVDRNKNELCVDLHLFGSMEAQFVLRYIIGFRLHEFLSTMDSLVLIVGSGKHSIKKEKLKKFIMADLMRYNPPIPSSQHRYNAGRIVIKKQHLLPYLNTKTNYAKDKFTFPTDDWHWSDPKNDDGTI
eukprot:535955_1